MERFNCNCYWKCILIAVKLNVLGADGYRRLSIVIIVILEALIRLKRNTYEKLMISRSSRRDVSFPQDGAQYFPSICKNSTRLEVLELLVVHASLSAVFDEGDENLIACLEVCYVLNDAQRLD